MLYLEPRKVEVVNDIDGEILSFVKRVESDPDIDFSPLQTPTYRSHIWRTYPHIPIASLDDRFLDWYSRVLRAQIDHRDFRTVMKYWDSAETTFLVHGDAEFIIDNIDALQSRMGAVVVATEEDVPGWHHRICGEVVVSLNDTAVRWLGW